MARTARSAARRPSGRFELPAREEEEADPKRGQKPPPAADEPHRAEHDAHAERHRHAGVAQHALELRQHEADEDRERPEAGDAHECRIDQRRRHAVPEPRHAVEIFGQALQHRLEIAARLAGLDHAGIEGRESPRGCQRLRQRRAAAHALDHAVDAPAGIFATEIERGGERAVERQPGIEQHRKLARECRKLGEGRAALAAQLEPDRLRPEPGARRVGANGREARAVQFAHHRPLRWRVHRPLDDFAGAVDGLVAIDRHG